MPSTVFISHAGADAAPAAQVAALLAKANISARFDRAELTLGDSFLTFMNDALSTSDYCLLLWSKPASVTPWVEAEWQAAFHRSVREKRAFLVVGRLEALDVPALLAPRLRVDLFPAIAPGVSRLVDAWAADRRAETLTGKPVGAARTEDGAAVEQPDTVYISSEAFQITTPMTVRLEEPAGAVLDRVIAAHRLPRELSHGGTLGVRFSYQLLDDEVPLVRSKSLGAQGITNGRVLTLQTTMTSFSSIEPAHGQLSGAVFRGGPDDGAVAAALRSALAGYRDALSRAGLRSTS